jgi:hypothetical protein
VNGASIYFNQNEHHSIVLEGVADANDKFICSDLAAMESKLTVGYF